MNSCFSITSEKISVSHFVDGEYIGQINGDHCHDRYEITYLVSASGSYIVEGSEQRIARGTLMLICPMSYHRVCLDNNEIDGFSVYFTKDALTPGVLAILDKLTDKGSSGLIFSQSLLSDEIVNSFERFSVASRFAENESAEYMQALLSQILILLSATEGDRISHTNEELGARVARYLNSNIEKSLSLDRLARRFFVSKYHLCRAFKSYSGTSVHAYVNHKKIMYAKSLIESGLTASGAAERVGFGDYSAFYRAYVKIVGKSPTA